MAFPDVPIEDDDGNDVETVDFGAAFDDDEQSPLPVVGPTTVELPGGLGLPDGTIARQATVRELTGYDEEQLARGDIKRPIDFVTKLIALAVENIGGQRMSPMMLNSLLLGDRDTLVIGVRRATFGDHLMYEELECPQCQRKFDADVTLDEIPIKKLDDPVADRQFEVTLLRGSHARMRLATHGDHVAMLEATSRIPEQNTLLLTRCLLQVGGVNVQMDNELPEDIVKRLNMRDRQLLIDELRKRQPGPDFEGVKVSCPGCGYEDRLVVDPIGMFRI